MDQKIAYTNLDSLARTLAEGGFLFGLYDSLRSPRGILNLRTVA